MSDDFLTIDDYGAPFRLPYHLGIFLAVNAISDAFVVIDGPDCVFRKTEWVHGRHDTRSTLLDAAAEHRVAHTLMTADRVVRDKGEALGARVAEVIRDPRARVVLVCSMPHVTIIGTQYDRILRRLESESREQRSLIEVPGRTLDGDWLDGYAATLSAIAERIDVTNAAPDPRRVAIVGHLMDRTEEDQRANVQELKRLVSALGLDLVSVWLDGGRYEDLARARDAGTLVALPLGRVAATTLARRTGARVLEAATPFGPGRTQRLLRALGRATGTIERAEALIDAELQRLVPRLEWVVPHALLHRRVAFNAPPDLWGGMLQLAAELGVEVVHLSTSAQSHHLVENLAEEFGSVPPMQFAPTEALLAKGLAVAGASGRLDLTIGETRACTAAAEWSPVMEFGFPSHFDHALYARPFLGFEGWMSFVDRMVRALARPPWLHRKGSEASTARRPTVASQPPSDASMSGKRVAE